MGPLLGSNQGWVLSQGQVLAERLSRNGYEVLTTSAQPARWRRLRQIVFSLVLWRNKYDVVIIMVFSGPAFWVSRIALRVATALGKSTILWLHGGNLPEYLKNRPRAALLMSRADHVVAPSSYLMSEVPSTASASIIPNILPSDNAGFTARSQLRPRILWMRTFHPIYRPHLALEVFMRVQKTRRDAVMTMAGQDRGHLTTSLSKAESLGLNERVRFFGFADESDKAHLFETHDIFLNTSVADNYPVTLLEAAAAGLPIVTTDVGGIGSLFTADQDALLVKEATPKALAGAIERLLSNAELAHRLSSAGRRKSELCTWANVGPQWDGLLSTMSVDGRGDG